MIEIKVKKGGVQTMASGEVNELAAELCVAVASLANSMREIDKDMADAFVESIILGIPLALMHVDEKGGKDD